MRFLLLAFAFVACTSSGEVKVGADTDLVSAADTDVIADTDIEDTVPEDTDLADTDVFPMDTDVSQGSCDNTADLAALAAAASTIADTTQSCVFSCIRNPRLGPCVADCIGSDVGLTTPCSTCFGNISVCVANQCLTQCLDATSAACDTCRVQKCEPAFVTCSGIQPP